MNDIIKRCTEEKVVWTDDNKLLFRYHVNIEKLIEAVACECLSYVRWYSITGDDVDRHDSINFARNRIIRRFGLTNKFPKVE